jgi:1-acyl-sn-glycerol-3-phosphate acyltransferase
MNKIRGLWGFLSSLCSGIVYRYKFEEPIDWARNYIICPNHTSNLDISAISVLAKNNYSFMGKEELLDGFVTGLFFRSVDIPVNRKSKMSSFRAFMKASERLVNGMTMVIFPEGTIPENFPPKLQEFKNGPFKLAIELKVPIIPVTLLDIWQVLWDNGLECGSRPGICHIFVHKPIETAHLTIDDADWLRDEVRNIISKKLEDA